MFSVPNKYRITDGSPHSTTPEAGNNGGFILPALKRPNHGGAHRDIYVIASDGGDWEHVSVHIFDKTVQKTYTPTWDEMCHVKHIFWGPEDIVMQLHPAEKEYVNIHPNVLHLWRPISQIIPTPPESFV